MTGPVAAAPEADGRPEEPLGAGAVVGTSDGGGAQGGPQSHTPGVEVVQTGDVVIDAALRDLSSVPEADLDAHIEAAESLQRALQGRLADLGE